MSTNPRVLAFAPDPDREEWIANELRPDRVPVQISRSVAELVTALVERAPPRPEILIADFDAMNARELTHLHCVRTRGWFGQVIALGVVPIPLRLSMRIDRVLTAPVARNTLRAIVAHSLSKHANV